MAEHGVPLAANQVHYNLLYRHPEANGVLAACRELKITLIAHSPLEQGILSGKFRDGSRSRSFFLRLLNNVMGRLDPVGDTSGSMSWWQRVSGGSHTLPQERWEQLFVVLSEIAHAREKTIAQVALNWLLTSDEYIIPIPDARNARQACENAGVLDWRLTRDEYVRINGIGTL